MVTYNKTCRASLSPWYVKGGINPLDDTDYPVFEGRCNLGAITLHLPMILAKARQENEDFYKVIKGNKKVEIQAYNLSGTLNLPFENIKPKARIPKLKLPSRLIEIVYQDNSTTTLLVSLNEGWQISFRIHNASSRVEPSLKFDINLVSAPHTLFTNHIFIA